MKLSTILLTAALTAVATTAAGADDCTGNGDRMVHIRTGISWCLNPANNAQGNSRHLIIFGRYNSDQFGPMVKKGYGICQGHNDDAMQSFDFCNEHSFIVAAGDMLPAGDKANYPEASKNPETGAETGDDNRVGKNPDTNPRTP